ncbi:MAG: flavodoxin [Lachnospiraceae bacterium]|nr:flavodoxin [Lachnospiraceae bacterium]
MKRTGKKIVAFLVCFVLFMGVAVNGYSTSAVAATTKKEVKQSAKNQKKKVLVVYFSRTGTTKTVAKKIKKMTGGTLFRIQTKKKYPSSYDKMLNTAQKEQDEKVRPALKKRVKSMKKYDTILIGYPVWWGDAPMAVYSFLESYDLSGKTIIPFCTSGGTGIGDSVKNIKKVCKGAKVKTGLTANSVSDKRIREWLKKNKVIQ